MVRRSAAGYLSPSSMISIDVNIYNGMVKINSPMVDIAPRAKASEALLILAVLMRRVSENLWGMNISVVFFDLK